MIIRSVIYLHYEVKSYRVYFTCLYLSSLVCRYACELSINLVTQFSRTSDRQHQFEIFALIDLNNIYSIDQSTLYYIKVSFALILKVAICWDFNIVAIYFEISFPMISRLLHSSSALKKLKGAPFQNNSCYGPLMYFIYNHVLCIMYCSIYCAMVVTFLSYFWYVLVNSVLWISAH